MLIRLILVFLLCMGKLALAEENQIDFDKLSNEAMQEAGVSAYLNDPEISEANRQNELLYQQLLGQQYKQQLNQEIMEARKDAELAQLRRQQQQHLNAGKYFERAWEHRLDVFRWQYISSMIIFAIVVLIILSGLYFSYLQFRQSNYGISKDNPLGVELSASTEGGVRISSPVIGVIILCLSLGFFYLYLTQVYPIQDSSSDRVSQTDDEDKKSSEASE